MRNELFIKACYASAAIPAFTLVKHGAADAIAAPATAASDAVFGVADSLGAEAANDPVDIIRGGIAEVMYGGTITRGDPLTAMAGGLAVKAATGNRIIGFAEVSGVAGDRGSVFIAPGVAGTIA
jgi:hypothetical protein